MRLPQRPHRKDHPAPKGGTPIWFALLKPSGVEAFSCDSDLMKEAQLHFFSPILVTGPLMAPMTSPMSLGS